MSLTERRLRNVRQKIKRPPLKKLASKKLSLFLLATLLSVGAIALVAGNEQKTTTPTKTHLTTGAVQLSSEQKEDLVNKFLAPCNVVTCFWKAAGELTAKYGPAASSSVIEYFTQKNPAKQTGDIHELAHVIGRKTASAFGVSGPSFLLCPTTFNYGCMHGFFEEALGHTNSTREAVDQICGTLEADSKYSEKFKFYCYHGVGHGIMQSLENDLATALLVCDGLKTPMSQDGCWQGVFMENVNAEGEGKARAGIFVADDPLAPCSRLESKYQHECYINHAARLVKVYSGELNQASTACLKAQGHGIQTCLESLGLMVTNPTWQPSLKKHTASDNEQKGWELCQQFPIGHVESCVVGGVDQILQMDELNVSRAQKFCKIVQVSYHGVCFRRLGVAIKAQVIDVKDAMAKCNQFEEPHKKACLEGASA